MKESLEQLQAALYQASSGYIGMSEITRKALKIMRHSLKMGISHSRRHMETNVPLLEKELAECLLAHQGPVHINSNVRMFDLVRYMRRELHEANLISDAEYTWLCAEAPLATSEQGGGPSPRRLEDYDDLRAVTLELITALQHYNTADYLTTTQRELAAKVLAKVSGWKLNPVSKDRL
jgi:hypothetical protein